MPAVTLGILAHVDAGKTSLTERLLYDAGAIPHLGRVDDGTTRTDAHELERLRGITIRTAVATFTTGGQRVHVVDTPGHPDFVAEVERALTVLDGAVLVVSATAGVQPQTTVLMRALTRLRVPALIFVNKTDRPGVDRAALLAAVRARLSPAAMPADDPDPEALADLDEDVLAAYVTDSLTPQRIRRALTASARRGLAYPVYFGSAVTGDGIPELAGGIRRFLPAVHDAAAREPLHATVFGIERDPAGRRVAFLRVRSGTVAVREQVTGHHGGHPYRARITAVDGGGERLVAGDVARVWGLSEARIGDHLGAEPVNTGPQTQAAHRVPAFAPPALGSAVTAEPGTDPARLHAALRELADQDPLIGLRTGPDGELSVRVHGQVQREVIAARLRAEFGVAARFAPIRPVCVERLARTGTAEHHIDPRGANDVWATVGLRLTPTASAGAVSDGSLASSLTPGQPDSGVRYRLAVQSGLLPRAFYTAIEDSVHAAARRGPHGWEVVDFTAELTAAGYASPLSTAGDFRALTERLVGAALRAAGTVVCAPVSRFELETPADRAATVLSALARLGGTVGETGTTRGVTVVTGILPSAEVQTLHGKLPALAGGEGVLRTEPAGYR